MHRTAWMAMAVAAALALASVAPIHNPDYWWHLAAGRWIVEHGALPLNDPFGVASTREPWVNGEWLFQIPLYLLYSAGGHSAVSIALAIGIGMLFAALFLIVARKAGAPAALLVTLICWYGAWEWLRERPATAGAVFLVALLCVLRLRSDAKRIAGVAIVTAIWINVHPSALIAPIVAALHAFDQQTWRSRLATPAAALAALLINPYGIEGIRAPIHLTRLVEEFENLEWQPSTPADFPLFFVVLAAALVLFVFRRERLTDGLVLLFLGAIAIRYCRNQGLFWASAPLLVSGSLPPVPPRLKALIAAAPIVAYLAILPGTHFSTAIDTGSFPVASAARVRASGLRGNIYTFFSGGGFLIWSFYPERRVITDGRNELYVDYEREHRAALRDGDRWKALIRRYDLRIAFYFRRHQKLLEVPDRRTGRTYRVPATMVYFPPNQWALIAREPAAVVFARRDAFSAEQLRALELPRSGF